MIFEIISLIVLIALSAFFSGSETAFMSLGKFKLKEYVRKKKKNHTYVKLLKDDPHTLITTVLIGNNFANIAGATLATFLGMEIFTLLGMNLTESVMAGIITGVLTLIVLIFGEIIPKTYSNAHYERVVGHSAQIIYNLSIVLKPLIWALDLISKRFAPKHIDKSAITEEEIKTIVAAGSDEGGIDKFEKHLIHKIFQFDDKTAKEVMTPRPKVHTMNAKLKVKDAVKELMEEGYSRTPLYEKDTDNIIGIFYIKDILEMVSDKKIPEKTLKSLSTKPLFVPQSKPVDKLFKEMQKKKLQMCIVVDEFGGFSGIITMEDLLEEIVGELYDEDDAKVTPIRKLGPKEFSIKGETTLRDVHEKTGLLLDGMESETISSYILSLLERIPKQKEVVKVSKGRLIIDKATDKTIEQVRLKL